MTAASIVAADAAVAKEVRHHPEITRRMARGGTLSICIEFMLSHAVFGVRIPVQAEAHDGEIQARAIYGERQTHPASLPPRLPIRPARTPGRRFASFEGSDGRLASRCQMW